jgi:MYXO-CTERM domain-containing protein
MHRISVVASIVVLLALAPAAAAKGPHAVVTPGPDGLEPGQPWVATLELYEFDRDAAAAAQPTVIVRGKGQRFRVRARRLAAHRFRLRLTFPRAGRWYYTVRDGTPAQPRFRFPAVTVGHGLRRDRTAYVAFPAGSRAEAQGGGGPIMEDPEPVSGTSGGALPPEVLPPPGDPDDDGVAVWVPLAGLTLAGAGTLTVLRRRRRR